MTPTDGPRPVKGPRTALLHYTAPPVVGGVEAVIQAHAQVFIEAGYPVSVVAGWGERAALPSGTGFVRVPEMDSQNHDVARMSATLNRGQVPVGFDDLVNRLVETLTPILKRFDNVIVHNVFTKHFNLPLTAALSHLLVAGAIRHCIAWCHDFTWTSPHSRSEVHSGYPWDLLRAHRSDVTYVVVSRRRQRALAALFGCSPDEIHVVYNGVDPQVLLGLSGEGWALVTKLLREQGGESSHRAMRRAPRSRAISHSPSSTKDLILRSSNAFSESCLQARSKPWCAPGRPAVMRDGPGFFTSG